MAEVIKLTLSKLDFVGYLRKRIQKAQDIDKYIQSNSIATEKHRRDVKLWNDINSDFLSNSFTLSPNKYTREYESNDDLSLVIPSSRSAFFYQSFISDKIYRLEGLIERAEHMKELEAAHPSNNSETRLSISNNKVFIVHGRDELRHQVARVLTKLDLEPIILQEQPSEGRTIIENFEEHSNVGFAIVLLTGDDVGRAKDDVDLQKRARQNVILELGYFMGRLSRKKVMTLISDGVEKPSDIHGLLYCKLDADDAWKLKLGKELKAAGYNVDLNKLD